MTAKSTPDLTFEAAFDQLTAIVAELEQGAPALDTALARYEQAIGLLAHCHKLIDGAERTVALLSGVDDQGQPLTAPFDTSGTTTRESPTRSARKVSPDSANPSRSRDSDNSASPF